MPCRGDDGSGLYGGTIELEERHQLLQLIGLIAHLFRGSGQLFRGGSTLLIWPIPEDCSFEAAVISCTSSEVLLIEGTIRLSSFPARSASSTLEPATVEISCAAT